MSRMLWLLLAIAGWAIAGSTLLIMSSMFARVVVPGPSGQSSGFEDFVGQFWLLLPFAVLGAVATARLLRGQLSDLIPFLWVVAEICVLGVIRRANLLDDGLFFLLLLISLIFGGLFAARSVRKRVSSRSANQQPEKFF